DVAALAEALARPVLVVTRRDTASSTLARALEAAGLAERLAILARTPAAEALAPGLFVAWAGTDAAGAERLARATVSKANIPEPLRVAHLIGAAIVRGHSHGRV